GMCDVVGLVEKAAEAVEAEDAARLERKLRTASFDFNDFLAQFKMMRKMGPLENILGMLPGMSNVQGLSIDEKQLKRTEAIVLSMTNEERARPDILNARRRQRIARGSGCTVTEVNDLLRRFDQMRKIMKSAGKMKKNKKTTTAGEPSSQPEREISQSTQDVVSPASPPVEESS